MMNNLQKELEQELEMKHHGVKGLNKEEAPNNDNFEFGKTCGECDGCCIQ
jgi:hypothetical protein